MSRLPAPVLTVDFEYLVQFDDGTFITQWPGTPSCCRSAASAQQELDDHESQARQGLGPRLTGGRVIRRVTTTAVSWEEEPFE